MKRGYLLYALILVPVLACALLAVRLLTVGEYDRALRKLGKGEAAYQQARMTLVLGAGDASAKVVEFAVSPRTSNAAKLGALRVLEELARQKHLDLGGREIASLLQGTPGAVSRAALETLEVMASPEALEDIAVLLRSTQDTALQHACLRAMRAAGTTLAKRIRAARYTDDVSMIDSCIALCGPLATGKAQAFAELAEYYRARGDTAQARVYRARIAHVDTLWAVGPFPNDGIDGFAEPFAPEVRPFNPADTFLIDKETIGRWVRVSALDRDNTVNFSSLYSKRCCSVSYLRANIGVPSARDALLLLSYYEPVKVWLNDSLVLTDRVYRGIYGDDTAVPVRLRAGVNTLLIKCVQDLHSWKVGARLADYNGDAFADLSYHWNID